MMMIVIPRVNEILVKIPTKILEKSMRTKSKELETNRNQIVFQEPLAE
jgi:hypothetical protein